MNFSMSDAEPPPSDVEQHPQPPQQLLQEQQHRRRRQQHQHQHHHHHHQQQQQQEQQQEQQQQQQEQQQQQQQQEQQQLQPPSLPLTPPPSAPHRNASIQGKRLQCPITMSPTFCPLRNGVEDDWTWSKRHRSKEVVLSGPNFRTVYFHPNWSKGTAGIQGKRPLNNGRYYWELHVSQRVFGTSIMFGIGTKNCRLHANAFRNMLGENEHGWGLSHKGVLWHNGVALLYTKRFRENHPTQIGILFDGIQGTLTYYKDGKCLGVAFRGLDKVKEPLYPIVCSTAAKTEMTLKYARREFVNLQDRCRAVIMRRLRTNEDVEKLKLPLSISEYLGEVIDNMEPLRQVDNYDILCGF